MEKKIEKPGHSSDQKAQGLKTEVPVDNTAKIYRINHDGKFHHLPPPNFFKPINSLPPDGVGAHKKTIVILHPLNGIFPHRLENAFSPVIRMHHQIEGKGSENSFS